MTLRCNAFVDFVIPLSSKTPTFESISGRTSSKKTFKDERSMKQSTKTSRRSITRVTKYCKTQICTIWNSFADPPDPVDPADPPDPADQVSGAAARNHPSTRAGGQDDVSSNKLPQKKSQPPRATMGSRLTFSTCSGWRCQSSLDSLCTLHTHSQDALRQ